MALPNDPNQSLAVLIDAIDLLYSERFAGFCLVSSDSDFTRLAARIRDRRDKLVYVRDKRRTLPNPA